MLQTEQASIAPIQADGRTGQSTMSAKPSPISPIKESSFGSESTFYFSVEAKETSNIMPTSSSIANTPDTPISLPQITPSELKSEPLNNLPASATAETDNTTPMDTSELVESRDNSEASAKMESTNEHLPSATPEPDKASPMDLSPKIGSSSVESNANSEAAAAERMAVWKEAQKVYTHIYDNEFKGGANGKISKEDSLPCFCQYKQGTDDPSMACGEDSNCINRTLFIECMEDDCPCGKYCMNRRFQQRQYAPIEIFRTEKKGFGLRAMKPISSGQFIIEYCGEVIPQSMFQKRALEYDQAGKKHFYFMSLKSDEFIDASRKGNMGRFMNHSCAPNCALQKWIVGPRRRIGIFATKDIAQGQELTFDYKFERYGAKAQVCHCGEYACSGFIGGSKHLELQPVEDDDDDECARAATAEEEEAAKKGLETVVEVQKMVKALLLNSYKPQKAIRLLHRLEATTELPIQRKFMQYHGLLVLKQCLVHYLKSDAMICSQVLRVLTMLPIWSRNSVVDIKLEETVEKLMENCEADLAHNAEQILCTWKTLPIVYKIPKRSQTDIDGEDKNAHNLKRSGSELSEQSDKKVRWETPVKSESTPTDVLATTPLIRPPKSDIRRYVTERPAFPPPSTPVKTEVAEDPYLGIKPSNGHRYSNSYTANRSGNMYSTPLPIHYQNSTSNYQNNSTHSPPPHIAPSHSPYGTSDPDLPPHWKGLQDRNGALYYWNQETDVTQWEHPSHTIVENTGHNAQEYPMDVDREALDRQDDTASPGFPHADLKKEEKQLRGMISSVVVKYLSKVKSQVDSEKFKKMARKMTQILCEKERSKSNPIPDSVNDEMKKRIRKFVYAGLAKEGIHNDDDGAPLNSKSKEGKEGKEADGDEGSSPSKSVSKAQKHKHQHHHRHWEHLAKNIVQHEPATVHSLVGQLF
ncbi:hypothetical protein BJ742DRAFT_192691 [Cladochytrium replicatum]|nr:hypothetical protein BJ742DRAFT_192691 [Cladochytrium replicatum]